MSAYDPTSKRAIYGNMAEEKLIESLNAALNDTAGDVLYKAVSSKDDRRWSPAFDRDNGDIFIYRNDTIIAKIEVTSTSVVNPITVSFDEEKVHRKLWHAMVVLDENRDIRKLQFVNYHVMRKYLGRLDSHKKRLDGSDWLHRRMRGDKFANLDKGISFNDFIKKMKR